MLSQTRHLQLLAAHLTVMGYKHKMAVLGKGINESIHDIGVRLAL